MPSDSSQFDRSAESTIPMPRPPRATGSLQDYGQQLREDLPKEFFEPTPGRMAWLPAHLIVIGLCGYGIVAGEFGVGVRLLLSAVIGHSFGCLAFLAHEILHGTIVRSRRWQDVTAAISMLPYLISPGHWRAWHNRFHHGRTNRAGEDPDGFGDIVMVRRHRVARMIAQFAPGTRYLRSFLFPFFWFSAQAILTLFLHSKHYNYWSPKRRRKQFVWFWGMAAFWLGVWGVFGTYNFLFLYVVPIMFANIVQMSYITTNHLLCDENVQTNDPLVNSLSVTVPRWVDWIHLHYSHHIEHHICPRISPRFAPQVRQALINRFGNRYRQIPLLRALRMVYGTPRIYLEEDELVDLRNGDVYSTLGTEGEPPEPRASVPVPVRPRRRTLKAKRKTRQDNDRTRRAA